MLIDLKDECNNVIIDSFDIEIDDLYMLQTNIQTLRQGYDYNY